MPLIIGWIIQLIIFFTVVSSIASFFSKSTKNKTKQKKVNDPSEVEAPKRKNKNVKRNEQPQKNKEKRSQREKKYTRTPRARDRVRESYEPIIKDVVTIDNPYSTKEKNTSATFNKKKLKVAVIHKEILDKPVSMRDDW